MAVRKAARSGKPAKRAGSRKRRETHAAAARVRSTSPPAEPESGSPAEMDIAPEKVCFVVVKSREFQAKVDVVEADPGSNPSDEGFREILEDYRDDPTYEELKEFLSSLNEDEIANLLALAWMGRGDFGRDEWTTAVMEARRVEDAKAADYLIATPLIADYLEEGLSQLGHSCEDYEIGRL